MDANMYANANMNANTNMYKDYKDAEQRDSDFNKSVSNRTFDLIHKGCTIKDRPSGKQQNSPMYGSFSQNQSGTRSLDSTMTREYLMMKQFSEREQLLSDPSTSMMALDNLSQKHSRELRELMNNQKREKAQVAQVTQVVQVAQARKVPQKSCRVSPHVMNSNIRDEVESSQKKIMNQKNSLYFPNSCGADLVNSFY